MKVLQWTVFTLAASLSTGPILARSNYSNRVEIFLREQLGWVKDTVEGKLAAGAVGIIGMYVYAKSNDPRKALNVDSVDGTLTKSNAKTHERSQNNNLEARISIMNLITEKNFKKAMHVVASLSGGEWLAEKLELKLRKFVNKKLSAEDWRRAVENAYDELLEDYKEGAESADLIKHPKDAIVGATMWAIL